MSYKTSLIKIAVKWTPKMMILLGANIVLRGIAKLTDFNLDLDARTAYVQARLYGETDIIEVALEGFAVITEGESHKIFLQKAQANRPWLNNLLARVVGKAWPIPTMPQFKAYIDLVAELLQAQQK